MRRSLIAALLCSSVFGPALGQSAPGLVTGQVPTAAQWNSYFAAKQDALGYTPCNTAGCFMTGPLTTVAAAVGASGFNLPPGSAPSSPNNGDVWVTSAGIYAQINGLTVGPLAASTGSPIGSSGQIPYNAAGTMTGFTMGGDCTFAAPNVTCLKTNGTAFAALATLGVGTGLGSSGGNLNITTVPAANGGTGVSNAGTVTLGASLVTTGTGAPTLAFGSSPTTQTFPTASATLAALTTADQTVTGGANVTSLSQSTGSISVDCGARPLQYITNGGAFAITAPSSDGSCVLLVTNNGSAGAVSFTGFSVGANTGDSLTTTNTSKFSIFIWRVNSVSGYRVAAHQ